MVRAFTLAVIVLLVAGGVAGCDGCTEVVVDGGGGAGAGPNAPFVGHSCQEVCQHRYELWGCDLDVCGDGCSEKALAELRAVGCEQAFVDYHNCTFEVGDSCDDGCPKEAGYAFQECIYKIEAYRKSMMASGAGGAG